MPTPRCFRSSTLAGWLLVGGLLHLGTYLSAAPAAGHPKPAKATGLQFVSASVTFGPGMEPPPGTVLPPPMLVGVLRVQHMDARRSSFRMTLVAPVEAKQSPQRTRIVPLTWATYDPSDKSWISWTCPWPGHGSTEGWTVSIEALRSRPRQVVSGPIQQFLLPAARPPANPNPSN